MSPLAEAACVYWFLCVTMPSLLRECPWGFSARPDSLLRVGPRCLVQALALQKDTWLLVLPLGATVLELDRG